MKRITTTSIAAMAALILGAGSVSAQVCNGTAPFSTGKMRVGVGLGFPDNGSSIDGEFAFGSTSGFYGGATVSAIDYENTDEGAISLGLNGGKAILIGTQKKIEMCPQLFVIGGSGPNAGTVETSSTSLGAGASFGTVINSSTTFDIIPFGAAFIRRDAIDITDNGTTVAEGSDTNLDIALGAGFVFATKWTVRPSLYVPLTGDGRGTAFSVMGSLNFGGR